MEYINLTAFCIGAATIYCGFTASKILRGDGIEHSQLNTMLGWVLAYMAVTNAKDFILTYPNLHTAYMHDAVLIIDGWSAIAFAMILMQLTLPGWVSFRRMAWMSVPFMAFSAAFFCTASHDIAIAYSWFLGVFGLSIIIFGYVKAARYIERIRSEYSNIDEIDISWVRYVYVLTFLTQLLWLVVSLIGEVATDCLYYLIEIATWQMIVMHCRNLKQIDVEEGEEAEQVPAVRTYPFADDLKRLMDDEQIYLDTNLTLTDLTLRLKTNRTYLSNYFADALNTSFYDYVNEKRTKHSITLMADHPEYTLEYISQQSGFNSLSTFRRAFRKFTGQNPSKFKA